MLSKRELEQVITELENAPAGYQNYEKLAHFYTIYDHLYSRQAPVTKVVDECLVGNFGKTDFLQTVNGMDAKRAWLIMDEVMDALFVVNPKLYDCALRKLK